MKQQYKVSYVNNLIGWKAAWVTIKAVFAYDDVNNRIVTGTAMWSGSRTLWSGIHTYIQFGGGIGVIGWNWEIYDNTISASISSSSMYGRTEWRIYSPLSSVSGDHWIRVSTTSTPNRIMIYADSNARVNYDVQALVKIVKFVVQVAFSQ